MKILKINFKNIGSKIDLVKKINPKMVGIFVAIISLPILLSLLFFYRDVNLKNLTGSLNLASPKKNDTTIYKNIPKSGLKLSLISEDEFLENFNPTPALLPKPIQLSKTLSGFIRSNSALELLPTRNWAVDFKDIESETALAIEMPTKRILYGKNVFAVRPIASLTKLVTAIVVYENLDLDEIVTISQKAFETEGISASLVAGEKLRVGELLYALLLESSNDAAIALQEHYDSGIEDEYKNFVYLMNEKMKSLGLGDTHFEEPTGLSEENRSSASSVAKILYEAIKIKKIASIMGEYSYVVEAQNKNITHYWVNLNTLLGAYPGIIGGKTGYTEEAGPSMSIISTTPNNERYIVIVVLNAIDRVQETRDLLNWIKEAYIWEE